MNCSICEAPLPEGARFCMTCGADLSDPEVSTRSRAVVKELFGAIKVAAEGHYKVTDLLGKGGMGAVFLAEDLRLGRTVAIKVLRPELATEGASIGRFEREARIAARLDHPNIIPVYAVEETDGLHYFVMKYIAGKSLDELLTGEPWPIEQCRQVLWQAACGLGHAHQRGVIHRDVKPSNIMIDENGRAIITDFGISKALQQDTQYTNTGQLIGTPRYVSPEQAQGLPLDGRSDQYSLAVVGYQMLVARLPLVADSIHALMYKHIYEVPASAQSIRPDVPVEISEALQRGMAKEPGDRFATMEEFATAIWPERPVHAGQPTPTMPGFAALAKLIGRRRNRVPAVAAAAVVVAGLAVAFLLGRGSEQPQALSPPAASVESVPAPPAPPPAQVTETAVAPHDTAVEDTVPPPAPEPPKETKVAPPPKPRPRPRPTVVRDTTRAAPVEQMGFLTINAVPYGTVSIDGVEIGDTPIVRRRLPPGEHTVRITRPGYRPQSSTVTVTAGNELRFSRTLIKEGQ